MTHAEFLTAYRRGEVRVAMDAKAAAHFLSAQLLLPLVAMPVLGIGVALAIIGWIYTGLVVIAAGIVVPRLIKRGATSFLLQRAIDDPATYDALVRVNVLRLSAATENPQGPSRTDI